MSEKFRSLELLLLLVQAKSKAKKKSYPDAFGTCECRKVLPTMHCSSKNHEVILKNCASAPLRENNTVNPVVRRLPVCQCTKGHHPPDPKTSRALAKTNFSLIRFITQRQLFPAIINPGFKPGAIDIQALQACSLVPGIANVLLNRCFWLNLKYPLPVKWMFL